VAHFDKSDEEYPTATLSCIDNWMKRVRLSDRDGGNKRCKLIDDKHGKECNVIAFWSSGSRAGLHSYVVHSFCIERNVWLFLGAEPYSAVLFRQGPILGDGIMGIYSGFGLLTEGLYGYWLDLRIMAWTIVTK
jgi:hypothetical protein